VKSIRLATFSARDWNNGIYDLCFKAKEEKPAIERKKEKRSEAKEKLKEKSEDLRKKATSEAVQDSMKKYEKITSEAEKLDPF